MAMTVGVFKNRFMKDRVVFRDLKREPFEALETLDEVVEIDDALTYLDIKAKLTKYLLTLKPREERVIREMFFYGKTLEEVGMTLNVTRERVRTIKCCALRKLKNYMNKDEDLMDLIGEKC